MARILLDNAVAFSEFWGYNDTCGPAALAMCYHPVYGDAISGPIIDAIRNEMVAHGWFSGGCTIQDLANETGLKGRPGYFPDTWHWRNPNTALKTPIYQNAGTIGLVLQVQEAHNLPYNEGGVHVHFIALFGQDTSSGEIAIGNGDDIMALNANNGHGKPVPIRWITWAQLNSAVPSAMLGIYDKGKGPWPVGLPAGWTDDGTTMKAPNGIPVVKGFRNYILHTSWNPANYPMEPERAANPVERSNPALGAGTLQTFRLSRLAWTTNMGVYVTWIGQELLYDEAHLATGPSAGGSSHETPPTEVPPPLAAPLSGGSSASGTTSSPGGG